MRWQRADIVVDPHIGNVILARWYLQILNHGVERHCASSVTRKGRHGHEVQRPSGTDILPFSRVSKDSITMAIPAPGPANDSCTRISYRVRILCLSESKLTSQTGIWGELVHGRRLAVPCRGQGTEDDRLRHTLSLGTWAELAYQDHVM
jgi:hypothetical protein